MSQDSRDDVSSSSVADDDSSSVYEELLTAVVNAKEGARSLSDVFKVLPPEQVRTCSSLSNVYKGCLPRILPVKLLMTPQYKPK